MKRFRFTLIAVCLVLLWLGWQDISLFFANRTPAIVSIEALESGPPPRDWLRIEGGVIDLERAISTSGSIELEALLVPLSTPGANGFRVLIETRDSELLQLFATYHLGLDTDFEKKAFRERHADAFRARRDVTGMVISGIIASGNRDKLMKLARAVEMEVPEDVLFVSEGEEPPRYRGFFFAIVGALGLIRLIVRLRGTREPASDGGANLPPTE